MLYLGLSEADGAAGEGLAASLFVALQLHHARAKGPQPVKRPAANKQNTSFTRFPNSHIATENYEKGVEQSKQWHVFFLLNGGHSG